ncbi:MAG: hypothetical protein ACRDDZ_11260 [Marinifilaceae bacterium]
MLGICYSNEIATDNKYQIYINPTIEELLGDQGILSVLTHELVHACGVNGHGKQFRELGLYIGLEGMMSCSIASATLQNYFIKIVNKLGTFPHACLTPQGLAKAQKPDKCRMFKCECPMCGYTVRIANKWISYGVPMCPSCDVYLEKEEK